MITVNQLKKVNTLFALEALGIGNIYCDISERGGGIGFYADDIARTFNVHSGYLPRNFGAGCNYLGGGVRGKIFPSTFATDYIKGKKAELLNELAAACVRVYQSIEDDNNMNDETNDDGEINWDAKVTNASRKPGIFSAY